MKEIFDLPMETILCDSFGLKGSYLDILYQINDGTVYYDDLLDKLLVPINVWTRKTTAFLESYLSGFSCNSDCSFNSLLFIENFFCEVFFYNEAVIDIITRIYIAKEESPEALEDEDWMENSFSSYADEVWEYYNRQYDPSFQKEDIRAVDPMDILRYTAEYIRIGFELSGAFITEEFLPRIFGYYDFEFSSQICDIQSFFNRQVFLNSSQVFLNTEEISSNCLIYGCDVIFYPHVLSSEKLLQFN